MTNDSIFSPRFQLDGAARTRQPRDDADEDVFDKWFDPIESAVRGRVRSFIEELIASELETVLARPRYGRRAKDSGVLRARRASATTATAAERER